MFDAPLAGMKLHAHQQQRNLDRDDRQSPDERKATRPCPHQSASSCSSSLELMGTLRQLDGAQLSRGQLVAAAFDEAACQSTDPREVLRVAVLTVMRAWRAARRTSLPLSPPTTPTDANAVRSWWLGRRQWCYSMSCMPARPPDDRSRFFGRSAISASVVSMSEATDAACCSATRTTLVGSMTPAWTKS